MKNTSTISTREYSPSKQELVTYWQSLPIEKLLWMNDSFYGVNGFNKIDYYIANAYRKGRLSRDVYRALTSNIQRWFTEYMSKYICKIFIWKDINVYRTIK